MKKQLLFILWVIFSYFGFFIINNLRNIINISNQKLEFVSIPIIISTIIFLFYIYKVRKKNKYLNITFLTLLLFFNICNGLLYTTNINTFFILYIVLMLYTFTIYTKIENYSLSLILSFTILIITTMILGMINLLPLVKYLIPISCIIILIKLYLERNKLNIKNKFNNFFDNKILIFTILFIISIIGGIGRYVHTYDEYSHWAYDAKAVIYYDKFSTSQEIMSKTRQYAPVITSWHYIVAQYSEYQEPNLYIGLAIFISIFLMSIIGTKEKNKYAWIIMLSGYAACFIFGGVYSFDTLYADLAFGSIFGASIICYLESKKSKDYNILLALLLVLLTLVKPSGCTASFIVLLYIMFDYLINTPKEKFIKKIFNFIKKYWKIILSVLGSFVIWQLYVKITGIYFTDYYPSDVRPWTLKSDISQKLNIEFILSFLYKLINSLDETLIYGNINVSLYQFLIIMFISIIYLEFEKSKKIVLNSISIIICYLIFFLLTALSIFIAFSYYEASILASFGRYLNSIHIALIMTILYLLIQHISNKSYKLKTIIFIIPIMIILLCPFKKMFYFITDINERENTLQIKNERTDKFQEVIESTSPEDKIFVIDQMDTDGIMAMWYARYYLFPRKVNASSNAITWKIKTSKNVDDLQDWGLNLERFKDELIKYNFDYLYLYSSDDEFFEQIDKLYDCEKKTIYEITEDSTYFLN